MSIRPDHGKDTSTLIISDHMHQCPNDAVVWVEQATDVRGL